LRQTLRLLGVGFWSLLSLDILIGAIDWIARWDWLKSFMLAHPLFAAFVRTPFVYAVLLILGFIFLQAERRLKLPKIQARFANSRLIPNLGTTTVQTMFNTEKKKPGWDEEPIDWHWFIEVHLVNDSDTSTVIEDVEIKARTGTSWPKREVLVTHSLDFRKVQMDKSLNGSGVGHGKKYLGNRYEPLVGLMSAIKGVTLTRGIPYRGWLRIEVPQVCQKDVNTGSISVDIWLIDAFQGRHKLHHKKKSDEKWDKNFFVLIDK
jgi:hypothetical protein